MNILSEFIKNLEDSGRCWIEVPKDKKNAKSNVPTLYKASVTGETFDEKVEHDENTAEFLYKKIIDLSKNPKSEEGKLAVKAAQVFNKNILSHRTFGERTLNASESYSAKLQQTIRINAIATALNLPIAYLMNHPDAVKFIESNILMYRIDKSYVERGLGPKIENNELCFPVNIGTVYKPDVVWIPWKYLPLDNHHKLKDAYGPFGFEKLVHPTKPDKLFPIKLVDTPENMEIKPGQVVIEMATSKTEKDMAAFVQKLLKGGPGHSWIRVYEPQFDNSGKLTGKSYMYSFGVRTGAYHLCSPDVREFKNDVKFSAYLPMEKDKWLSLKSTIEKLQEAFLHKVEPSQLPREVGIVYQSLMNGTCVNFAMYVFNAAHVAAYHKPIEVEGHTMFQTHLYSFINRDVLYIPSTISSVLRTVTPEFIKAKISNIYFGYMPWTAAGSLAEMPTKGGFVVPLDLDEGNSLLLPP